MKCFPARVFMVAVFSCLTCLCFSSLTRAADPWYEIHMLIPAQGGANDHIGSVVALSGSTAVVGAWGDDDLGKDSGAAYVFDARTGVSFFKLHAPDGNSGDHFAQAVSSNEQFIIIGAPDDDDLGISSGSVYVFDALAGTPLFKLLANDGAAGDQFGYSVAVDGDSVIVGAPFDDDHGAASGSVYVFDLTTGLQVDKITPSDGKTNANFGNSVAIYNHTACVGAWTDDVNSVATGSAYLYDLQSLSLLHKLTPYDGGNFDFFGRDVDVNANFAVVGADQTDVLGSNSGAVYIYDVVTGNQLYRLTADHEDAGDLFGTSVDMDGNVIIVGANFGDGHYSDTGAVYLFDATTGMQIDQLIAEDSQSLDFFGSSVAIDGDLCVIGSVLDDLLSTDAGAAYAFETGGSILTVSPDPMMAGEDAVFTITNATPNEPTYLAYSLRGNGATTVPFLGVALDLSQPRQADSVKTTDTTGFVEWTIAIPSVPIVKNVWLQGVQAGEVTNLVTTTVQP